MHRPHVFLKGGWSLGAFDQSRSVLVCEVQRPVLHSSRRTPNAGNLSFLNVPTRPSEGMIADEEQNRMSDETLNAFYEVAEHVCKGDTVDETLASVMELATTVVRCEECCTYVRQGRRLVPWVRKHADHKSFEPATPSVDHGFAGALAAHRAPIAVYEHSVSGSVFRVFDDWSSNPGETCVGVPFLSRSQLVGAIALHHWRPHAHNRHELKLLCCVAHLLGADLGIARLENENSELLLQLETRKLSKRGTGDRQREQRMSEHEADLAVERQHQQKRRPLTEVAQTVILGADVKPRVVPTD
jgi:transcriptional regulator with GAF, ATPase, and Fis domain